MSSNSDPTNYTFTDINRYVSGGMSAAEMHDIERSALQDPFLADAIEGYRDADGQQSLQHLNEITAVIQAEKAEPKVVAMPQKRSYAWLAAASLIAVAGISVFLLYPSSHKQLSAPLAQNKVKTEEQRDTVSYFKNEPVSPLQDLQLTTPESTSLPKQKTTTSQYHKVEKKETPPPDLAASQARPEAKATTTTPATDDAYKTEKDDKATAMSVAPSPVRMDTLNEEVIVAKPLDRKARALPGNTWTTDKGKPFILSEVEEFHVGRMNKKQTDTSAVKPEGGWQSFQEYLFSRLSKKDTADFASTARFDGNLELEFSVTKKGIPYNIKVLNAQDSTTAKTAAAAVEQGPKWITAGKKEKRLNIRY